MSSQEQVFTPETDKLIRDIATMSDRWSINPFMFGGKKVGQASSRNAGATKRGCASL